MCIQRHPLWRPYTGAAPELPEGFLLPRPLGFLPLLPGGGHQKPGDVAPAHWGLGPMLAAELGMLSCLNWAGGSRGKGSV